MSVTFTTIYFDLASREERASFGKGHDFYLAKCDYTLGLPYPLEIICEESSVDALLSVRKRRAPEAATSVIVTSIEEFFEFHAEAKKLGPQFGNRKDTPLYAAMTWSKTKALREVAHRNTFDTRWFAFLDLALCHAQKPLNYETLQARCRPLPGKMRAMIIYPVTAHHEKNLKDFYQDRYSYACVAGGFLCGDREAIDVFDDSVRSEISYAIHHLERAPLEGAIWGVVARKKPDLFDPYFGHFDNILTNLEGPVGDHPAMEYALNTAHADGRLGLVEQIRKFRGF